MKVNQADFSQPSTRQMYYPNGFGSLLDFVGDDRRSQQTLFTGVQPVQFIRMNPVNITTISERLPTSVGK
jgi:hypothetical protein